MKAKPDISGFVGGKDPTAFLEAGAGDRPGQGSLSASKAKEAEREVEVAAPAKPEPTVQKLFRLRWDVANALKMGATQASIAAGKRVTETEIVEGLIRERFKIDS